MKEYVFRYFNLIKHRCLGAILSIINTLAKHIYYREELVKLYKKITKEAESIVQGIFCRIGQETKRIIKEL